MSDIVSYFRYLFLVVPSRISSVDIAAFVGAMLISGLLVEVIRRWALRQQRFDHPNERSSHTIPTPRGGGLAIVVVTLTGWILVNVFVWKRFDWSVWAYPLGAGLIAAVSWVDDLHPLPNSVRFATHSVGAIISIAAYGYWVLLPVPGHHLTLPFSLQTPTGFTPLGFLIVYLFTFLWIVWLTNAYNFMDGIDGIAGLQAVVAGVGWIAICAEAEEPGGVVGITLLCSLIIGSSLGFLWHNRPPARIFMGDVGSAFLGYSFAVMPFLLREHFFDSQFAHMSPPDVCFLFWPAVLFVWPFLFDTIFTFIRRVLKRENVFKAHRSHLFQRLVIAGCSHRFVTLLYGGLALEGAIFAMAWIGGAEQHLTYQGWVPILLSMFGLWAFTRWCEMRKLRATANSETQI